MLTRHANQSVYDAVQAAPVQKLLVRDAIQKFVRYKLILLAKNPMSVIHVKVNLVHTDSVLNGRIWTGRIVKDPVQHACVELVSGGRTRCPSG